jgi:hypothetical protein
MIHTRAGTVLVAHRVGTCLRLLDEGVVVQPGYDFERTGHLVLSLLPEPHVLREGVTRLLSASRR